MRAQALRDTSHNHKNPRCLDRCFVSDQIFPITRCAHRSFRLANPFLPLLSSIRYSRSPYARQRHDALLCCHAHAPHYCLPLLPHRLCYSAATALFRTTTAATCTLMAANKEERAASLFRRSPKANFPTSETHAPRAMSVPGPSRDRRSPRARPPPRGLSYVFVTRNRMYTARPHGPPNGAPAAAAGAELGEGQRKRGSRRLSTLVIIIIIGGGIVTPRVHSQLTYPRIGPA